MNNTGTLLLITCILLLSFSCKKDMVVPKELPTINDGDVPGDLKINEIQYLGSHNSYRIVTDADILEVINGLSGALPGEFNPLELDYTHIPIKDQLTFYGIRQLELDLFLDYNGGAFYNRHGYGMVGKDLASGLSDLQEPGLKLLHIPDVDFNTYHLSFKAALEELKSWSESYPEHIPIFVLIELKSTSINNFLPGLGFAETEEWDDIEDLNTLENEILDVFSKEDLILPDDVRGTFSSLNEAVLANNWPTIQESRGKMVFIHNNDNINSIYTNGAPNLENKILFTNASPGDNHAAFMLRNNPNNVSDIQNLVDAGYMVRTRSDAGTYEARNNDYGPWINALESGAHFISTDYYKADARAGDGTWSNYKVQFDNQLYRLNPITNP